ncbi:MAG: hypothetical protein IT454_16440 [Planctomycetes bacterium]|nr:hypothetical protein [Planctomycetota bacterium]
MKWTLMCVAALSAAASAQVSPTGPFTGQYQEDWSVSQFGGACMNGGAFAGTAQVCTPGGTDVSTTTGWSFMCYIPAAYSGLLFYGSYGRATEFTLSVPAYRFGGYFSINSGYADAAVDFYDASNNLIGTTTASIPADCAWHWQGWEWCNTPATRIVVTGLNPFGGGFVMMDALELGTTVPSSCAPTPTPFCTSGTTTNGCAALINASANPNVGHSAPCQISVTNVEGQKSGIIFYGLAKFPQPWCSVGGGTSFLCVKPPTMRTLVQTSGGTASACNGQLQLDWNAFQIANPSALGNPWTAGDKVYVQGWFRDPPACKTTSTSNSVELTYLP